MGSLAIIIFLALLAVIVSTGIFLGVGYALSCILPLSLFQGTLLSIGASFVVVFSVSVITIVIQLVRYSGWDHMDDDFDEDLDDEFDDDDDDDSEDLKNTDYVAENTVKIGRNRLCPCGSGIKYKRCCGKDK
jgi:hypothetical protein